MGEIATFYTQLRTAEDADALPITVRTLETIIRLSTAVAKSRLAKGARMSTLHCLAVGHRMLGLRAVRTRHGQGLQAYGMRIAGILHCQGICVLCGWLQLRTEAAADTASS